MKVLKKKVGDVVNYVRCEIISVLDDDRYKVECTKTKKQFTIQLEDAWSNRKLIFGEPINLVFCNGIKTNEIPNTLTIDYKSNIFLIEYPDILISTTTTVGSLWCDRQTIIKNYLFLDDYYEQTVMGTVIHGTVQHIIITSPKQFNKDVFKQIVTEQTQILLDKIYVLELTREEFIKHAMEYYSTVSKWYTHWKNRKIYEKNECYNLKNFTAAEAQLQSQIFGLKGSIDILFEGNEGPLLVEMKTGKQKEENSAQLSYYFLLLSGFLERPYTEFSGLLNYVHKDSNSFVQIIPNINVLIDVTIKRNSLACYLKDLRIPNEEEIERKPMACNYCQLTEVCSLFCENEGFKFNEECTSHLNEREKTFYFKILDETRREMLRIDEENQKRWLSPDDTDSLGRDMKLVHTEETLTFPDYYIYTFEGSCVYDESLICVSTEDGRINLVKGYMLPYEKEDVEVNETQPLNDENSESQVIVLKKVKIRTPQRIIYNKSLFRLDVFKGTNSQQVTMTTISTLMKNNNSMKKIRDLIINGNPCPVIKVKKETSELSHSTNNNVNKKEKDEDDYLNLILEQLNIEDQTEIVKDLSEMDYFLLNVLSSSSNVTPIIGLTSDEEKELIINFLNQTTQRVFVTATNVDLMKEYYSLIPKEKAFLISELDECLKNEPTIETFLEKHNIMFGTIRDSTRKYVKQTNIDIAIVIDSINMNVLQSINIFVLTETVWLFEGTKVKDKTEENFLTQSIHQLCSRMTSFSIPTILDEETESRKSQVFDIEELDKYV